MPLKTTHLKMTLPGVIYGDFVTTCNAISKIQPSIQENLIQLLIIFLYVAYLEFYMKSSVLKVLATLRGLNSPLEQPKPLFSRKSEDAIQSFYIKQFFLTFLLSLNFCAKRLHEIQTVQKQLFLRSNSHEKQTFVKYVNVLQK